MKKFALLLSAFITIVSIAKGQYIRSDEKIEIMLLSRDVVEKDNKFSKDFSAYYYVSFKNKTDVKIDSLYGGFSITYNGNLLDFVDFACYEPISSMSFGNDIVKKKYSILKPEAFSTSELENSKDIQKNYEFIVKSEPFDLQYKLDWLAIYYKNGKVYKIQ